MPPPDSSVTVEISAVNLADQCGQSGERFARACAPDVPCPDLCSQSTAAMSITADGDGPLAFRVVSAALLDGETGAQLLDLGTRSPRIFEGEGYESWDEVVPTPSEISVLYDLTELDWSAIDGNADIGPGGSYSRTFRVQLVIEVGGNTRTVVSEEQTRQAPIVT